MWLLGGQGGAVWLSVWAAQMRHRPALALGIWKGGEGVPVQMGRACVGMGLATL